ncbi:MAG: SOS response-associated peptidase [Spiribacter salinus]|uniref:Abasic site processing protein n=1 Tax=Spiribacter salinus TaxID=1335746 RepID=A0A540VU80_9GAMM|nr:MAG: SOS response-associated peptidase [Spiribacter salinus]
MLPGVSRTFRPRGHTAPTRRSPFSRRSHAHHHAAGDEPTLFIHVLDARATRSERVRSVPPYIALARPRSFACCGLSATLDDAFRSGDRHDGGWVDLRFSGVVAYALLSCGIREANAMCGRFVSKTEAAIEREFNVTPRQWTYDWVKYNVAPTQKAPVVRLHEGECVGDMLRWGLVPTWAEGQPTKYSTINARVETVETAATYRNAWKREQRCVIPVLGYYEWKRVADRKQPYLIRMAGGEPFGLCGLWEASRTPDGELLESFTIVTVPANLMVAEIHEKARMPAIVTPRECAAWLEGSKDDARAMLTPFPAERMDAYPVSTRMNSPKNDDAALLERAV